MSKSEIVDVSMHIHVETSKAILASDDGDKEKAVWLPKSQVEIDRPTKASDAIITMPEWLAKEKGLI